MGYTQAELYEKLQNARALTGGNMTKIYGRSLNQPFANSNSAYRGQMFSIHQEHSLVLTSPDRAFVSTGHETKMGEYSSVFKRAEESMCIIGKIQKYPSAPNHHYWLITQSHNKLGIIERCSYRHTTESFGYLYNNEFLDNLRPSSDLSELDTVSYYAKETEFNRQTEHGVVDDAFAESRADMIGEAAAEAACTIYKGEVYKKSTSFDSANNYCMGLNMLVAYVDQNILTEDPVVISKSAAQRFRSAEIKPVTIKVNENDIFVNCHGDLAKGIYKPLPDVGEVVHGNTLYCLRRENKEDALYTQSIEQLSKPMMSDETIPLCGMVVDIDVACNNPSGLDSYYNQQLKYYWDNSLRYCEELVTFVDGWLSAHPGYSMDHELETVYEDFKRRIEGVQFINDDKPFNNIVVNVVVVEISTISTGDKVSNRYGGKGVAAKIEEDENMPRLNGKPIDVMWRSSTGINRENAGQYKENLLTSIGYQILEKIRLDYNENGSADKFMEEYLRFLDIVNEKLASKLRDTYYEYFTIEQKRQYVEELCEENCIHVMVDPVYNNLTLKDFKRLMDAFPFVHPLYLDVPITDSKGNRRWVKTSRPVGVGYQYLLMLKQKATEKYSEASFSVVNIRGENSKDGNKQFKNLHKRTPIRFGHMENGSFDHIGSEAVVTQMMLYGTSPTGRNNIGNILTSDNPFDIDIKLTDRDVNRKAEIVACDLKGGMGLKLVIKRTPRKLYRFQQKLFQFSVYEQTDDKAWERLAAARTNALCKEKGIEPPLDIFKDARKERLKWKKEREAEEKAKKENKND